MSYIKEYAKKLVTAEEAVKVVNSMHISRLNLSQGILHVEEKFVIPISRRYKSKVGIQLADSVEMSENRQSQTNIPADDSESHSAGRRGRTKET